jgi:hypothetical protein
MLVVDRQHGAACLERNGREHGSVGQGERWLVNGRRMGCVVCL